MEFSGHFNSQPNALTVASCRSANSTELLEACGRNRPKAGGLVSYGPDLEESYRRAATYVDRIFRGAKRGELAIEQPGKYEMVINMKAANALGLTIPQSVLLRATEVMQ